MTTGSEVVILGGGPAGYSCALRCADAGLQVTLNEERKLGGTCLHRGCVPTRTMLEAAIIADGAARRAQRWGLLTKFDGVDMLALIRARQQIVDRNERAIRTYLDSVGVRLVQGRGELTGPNEVIVADERISARRAIVLATGSRPKGSKALVPDGRQILTSDEALELSRVPRSMLILGGGAIGAEFSQLWRGLGCEVTLAEREDRLLPFEDADVGAALARALKRQGISVLTGVHVADVFQDEHSSRVTFSGVTGDRAIDVEVVVLAIGREPALDGLGIENTSVKASDAGVMPKDWDSLETHQEGIYVVGDLLPPPSIGRAHVAYAEGELVAKRISGSPQPGIEYRDVPRITHGIVETACVGLTEEEARVRWGDIRVASMPIGAVAKGAIMGEPGMGKVIVDPTETVIGIHLVGPQVSEHMGEAAAVVGFEASPSDVMRLVHPHPTLSEILGELHMGLAGSPLHLR